MSNATATAAAPEQRTLLGHPLGLYVLFFTEMWERFSFYGMKTLMVLYMLNHFFWSQEDASSLLGTYAALAYGVNPIGGFIADHYLGARKAVFIGGVLMVIGQFLLVNETLSFFYAGLVFLICGVGLLKPNISTQVGNLYKADDTRRDGAFTIFYMGINLGALIGPLICDWLRLHYGFGIGFGAAGVGMIVGLIVYLLGQRHLAEYREKAQDRSAKKTAVSSAADQPAHVIRDRIIVLLVIFIFVILFWTAFEQSPNVMLVWADKHTNLRLFSAEPPPVMVGEPVTPDASATPDAWWKFAMTSGQTQSFNPFFIITLAPIAAFFWLWLDRRGRQPSTPAKMALGVTGVALAFTVMLPAAVRESGPSATRLAALPSGIQVDERGLVFTVDKTGGEKAPRTYYGLKRLRYDTKARELQLHGVLPDNDRLRLLAETAPSDFKELVDSLVKQSVEKAKAAKRGQPWELTKVLASPPPGLKIVGDDLLKVIRYDEATRTLVITGEIKERPRMELLALAAEPDFKQAVDTLFRESSQYRVSVWWLVAFFLVLTMGELCLSPVGLSLVTKLAPAKHVGLFMGGWFLATAVAEKVAQVFGAMWGKMPPQQFFLIFVAMCATGAVVLAVLVRPLKRMMHGVQ